MTWKTTFPLLGVAWNYQDGGNYFRTIDAKRSDNIWEESFRDSISTFARTTYFFHLVEGWHAIESLQSDAGLPSSLVTLITSILFTVPDKGFEDIRTFPSALPGRKAWQVLIDSNILFITSRRIQILDPRPVVFSWNQSHDINSNVTRVAWSIGAESANICREKNEKADKNCKKRKS